MVYLCLNYVFQYSHLRRFMMASDWHVVLDLDEALVHTIGSSTYTVKVNNVPRLLSTGQFYNTAVVDQSFKHLVFTYYDPHTYWTVLRPGAKEFVIDCLNYFKSVSVWSAGEEGYVRNMVHHLFPAERQPMLVWSRNQCQRSEMGIYKDLKVYCEHTGIPLNRTLIVDDNATTNLVNGANNIYIKKFHFESGTDYRDLANDTELYDVEKEMTRITQTLNPTGFQYC